MSISTWVKSDANVRMLCPVIFHFSSGLPSTHLYGTERNCYFDGSVYTPDTSLTYSTEWNFLKSVGAWVQLPSGNTRQHCPCTLAAGHRRHLGLRSWVRKVRLRVIWQLSALHNKATEFWSTHLNPSSIIFLIHDFLSSPNILPQSVLLSKLPWFLLFSQEDC